METPKIKDIIIRDLVKVSKSMIQFFEEEKKNRTEGIERYYMETIITTYYPSPYEYYLTISPKFDSRFFPLRIRMEIEYDKEKNKAVFKLAIRNNTLDFFKTKLESIERDLIDKGFEYDFITFKLKIRKKSTLSIRGGFHKCSTLISKKETKKILDFLAKLYTLPLLYPHNLYKYPGYAFVSEYYGGIKYTTNVGNNEEVNTQKILQIMKDMAGILREMDKEDKEELKVIREIGKKYLNAILNTYKIRFRT